MPGFENIEEDTRQQIAAYSARSGEVSLSPFGVNDQIGMLNLLTPDRSEQALARADGSRVFDLSVDLFVEMPSWTAKGEPAYHIWMVHSPPRSVTQGPEADGEQQIIARSADAISMFTHCGTHVDTLNHFGYGDSVWNGFSVSEHLGSRNWDVAGADRYPPIITRGILIDVATAQGVDVLPDSYGIGEADLVDALARQGTDLRPGDVVMVRTGRGSLWPDAEAYLPNEPGVNLEGAEFLAKAGSVMVGADNVAFEQLPSPDPTHWIPVHTYLLAEAGIPIMEVVNLEELAEEECYEFVFVGACLKLRGATAGPMRPLAFPIRE